MIGIRFLVHREEFPLHSNKTEAFIYAKIDKNKRADVIKPGRCNPHATEDTIGAELGVNRQEKTKTVDCVLKIDQNCSILKIYGIDDVNKPFSVESFPV